VLYFAHIRERTCKKMVGDYPSVLQYPQSHKALPKFSHVKGVQMCLVASLIDNSVFCAISCNIYILD
jgi:hypothetical protein